MKRRKRMLSLMASMLWISKIGYLASLGFRV
jgi:hypothetical protein